MSEFWMNLVIVLHVLVALAIIGLVLLQHGKGADMGSGFGGGASSSLFGATGSANFLSRATAALATVFFLTSLGLAYLATHRISAPGGGVMEGLKQEREGLKQEQQEPQKPGAVTPPAEPAKAPKSESAPAVPAESKAKDVPN